MTTKRDDQQPLARRTLLRSFAVVGITLAISACSSASHNAATSTSARETAAAQSSSSSGSATRMVGAANIPKPLPTAGGPPPTVVGRNAASTAVASPPSHDSAVVVTITAGFKFSPAVVTINRGQTVTWKNAGRSPQTVTDDPLQAANRRNAQLPAGAEPFDSGVLNSDGVYSRVFNTPGEYVYFSVPYENKGMIGKVVVR